MLLDVAENLLCLKKLGMTCARERESWTRMWQLFTGDFHPHGGFSQRDGIMRRVKKTAGRDNDDGTEDGGRRWRRWWRGDDERYNGWMLRGAVHLFPPSPSFSIFDKNILSPRNEIQRSTNLQVPLWGTISSTNQVIFLQITTFTHFTWPKLPLEKGMKTSGDKARVHPRSVVRVSRGGNCKFFSPVSLSGARE